MTAQLDCIEFLHRLGIDRDDAFALRRIAMTLHRWHERECGDSNDYASFGLERDETTDLPYQVVWPHNSDKARRYRVPDRETGARKRLARIMARYPGLQSYVQGDPRGAALYILRNSDVPQGARVDAYYSRGVAVYK